MWLRFHNKCPLVCILSPIPHWRAKDSVPSFLLGLWRVLLSCRRGGGHWSVYDSCHRSRQPLTNRCEEQDGREKTSKKNIMQYSYCFKLPCSSICNEGYCDRIWNTIKGLLLAKLLLQDDLQSWRVEIVYVGGYEKFLGALAEHICPVLPG